VANLALLLLEEAQVLLLALLVEERHALALRVLVLGLALGRQEVERPGRQLDLVLQRDACRAGSAAGVGT
jgi:hypothetical protein